MAKGCSQRAGLDYTETFSPVIRMASLRLFLAIAAAMDLDLCQLDNDTCMPPSQTMFTSARRSESQTGPISCATSNAASTALNNPPPREFNMLLRSVRRRRSGGGPGEGCSRRPVGTYLYLHAVGVGNPIAVPSLAR
jgi:hypothetical protein